MTVVSDYTAILSGETWYGEGASDHPAIVTYSFNTEAQPYLGDFGGSQALIDSFQPFSDADKTMARGALQQWADASGITFIEAPPGQGDIQFDRIDFEKDPTFTGFEGYGFYPGITLSKDGSSDSALGGDVFIDVHAKMDIWLILHEIGHALGLKHPFEGDPTLDTSLDNKNETVMSYTGKDPTVLGPLDHDAAEYLYGDPSADGTNLASWSWNDATATLTQTGKGGADTVRGVYGNDIIYGGKGGDLLFGSFGDDVLTGKAGRDVLQGADGNDTLNGGKGSDELSGGAGANVYFFSHAGDSTGGRYDTIDGFDADQDHLRVAHRVTSVADVDHGTLDADHFNTGIRKAMDGHLVHHAAVLFTPDGGDLAGQVFLIVDQNSQAGYQSGGDLVIAITGGTNLADFGVASFI